MVRLPGRQRRRTDTHDIRSHVCVGNSCSERERRPPDDRRGQRRRSQNRIAEPTWAMRSGRRTGRSAPSSTVRTSRLPCAFLVSRKLLSFALGLIVLGCLWFWFAPVPLGGSTTYVVTRGISMEPRFHTGDLAIVRSQSSYHVGEIVAYHNNMLHTIVLHRIIGREGARYIFKGDNNSFIDPERPVASQLIGALWLHIPGAGAHAAVDPLAGTDRSARRRRGPAPHRSRVHTAPAAQAQAAARRGERPDCRRRTHRGDPRPRPRRPRGRSLRVASVRRARAARVHPLAHDATPLHGPLQAERHALLLRRSAARTDLPQRPGRDRRPALHARPQSGRSSASGTAFTPPAGTRSRGGPRSTRRSPRRTAGRPRSNSRPRRASTAVARSSRGRLI